MTLRIIAQNFLQICERKSRRRSSLLLSSVHLAGTHAISLYGKRSAIRELRLPPGMRATVARGAPPAPPPAPAEAPPEAPPSPEEPKKRWFERARKVSIR